VRLAAGATQLPELRAAPVEYDADLLDFLIRTGWLADADAGDKHKIGTAISAVMRDAARG
jgi:hypothetical protein